MSPLASHYGGNFTDACTVAAASVVCLRQPSPNRQCCVCSCAAVRAFVTRQLPVIKCFSEEPPLALGRSLSNGQQTAASHVPRSPPGRARGADGPCTSCPRGCTPNGSRQPLGAATMELCGLVPCANSVDRCWRQNDVDYPPASCSYSSPQAKAQRLRDEHDTLMRQLSRAAKCLSVALAEQQALRSELQAEQSANGTG